VGRHRVGGKSRKRKGGNSATARQISSEACALPPPESIRRTPPFTAASPASARSAATSVCDALRGLFGADIATWKAHDAVELTGKLAPGKVALYFDCGTDDDFALHDNVQYVHEALTARHIEHEYFLGPGKHDFAFWTARGPRRLAFLRDHTVKPQ
jgi:S-formylglutathione hydrolase FrmB